MKKVIEALPVITKPLIEGEDPYYNSTFGNWYLKYDPIKKMHRWTAKKLDGTEVFLTDEFPHPKEKKNESRDKTA